MALRPVAFRRPVGAPILQKAACSAAEARKKSSPVRGNPRVMHRDAQFLLDCMRLGTSGLANFSYHFDRSNRMITRHVQPAADIHRGRPKLLSHPYLAVTDIPLRDVLPSAYRHRRAPTEGTIMSRMNSMSAPASSSQPRANSVTLDMRPRRERRSLAEDCPISSREALPRTGFCSFGTPIDVLNSSQPAFDETRHEQVLLQR